MTEPRLKASLLRRGFVGVLLGLMLTAVCGALFAGVICVPPLIFPSNRTDDWFAHFAATFLRGSRFVLPYGLSLGFLCGVAEGLLETAATGLFSWIRRSR